MGGSSATQTLYDSLGSVNDLQQANPFTQNVWDMVTGNMSNLTGGNQASGIGVSDVVGRMSGAGGAASDLASQMMGEYGESAQMNRDAIISEAMRQTSGQFADQGALNSGAALSAMSRGAAQPAAQFAQQMAGMQTGLTQGIMQQAQGAETSSLQNLYGIAGQYGMPTFWQPTWVTSGAKEGHWGL